ncbi:MAG: hypothetical protein Q9162_000409 [Coniocarpon cinnabarinum]
MIQEEGGDPIHLLSIPQLDPVRPPDSTSQIHAILTLVWPYSSATRETSLLLAEPDFRLRRNKGQVRVHFLGPSAKYIASSGIGVGDRIELSLEGATWHVPKEAVATPGRSLEGELVYKDRVVLRVERDGQVICQVDINERTSLSPTSRQSSSPVDTPAPLPKSSQTKSLEGNLTWSSPIVIRSSQSGNAFFRAPYGDFAEEDGYIPGRGRKRTLFGRRSGEWRYSGEDISITPVESGNRNDDEASLASIAPSSPLNIGRDTEHQATTIAVDDEHNSESARRAPSVSAQVELQVNGALSHADVTAEHEARDPPASSNVEVDARNMCTPSPNSRQSASSLPTTPLSPRLLPVESFGLPLVSPIGTNPAEVSLGEIVTQESPPLPAINLEATLSDVGPVQAYDETDTMDFGYDGAILSHPAIDPSSADEQTVQLQFPSGQSSSFSSSQEHSIFQGNQNASEDKPTTDTERPMSSHIDSGRFPEFPEVSHDESESTGLDLTAATIADPVQEPLTKQTVVSGDTVSNMYGGFVPSPQVEKRYEHADETPGIEAAAKVSEGQSPLAYDLRASPALPNDQRKVTLSECQSKAASDQEDSPSVQANELSDQIPNVAPLPKDFHSDEKNIGLIQERRESAHSKQISLEEVPDVISPWFALRRSSRRRRLSKKAAETDITLPSTFVPGQSDLDRSKEPQDLYPMTRKRASDNRQSNKASEDPGNLLSVTKHLRQPWRTAVALYSPLSMLNRHVGSSDSQGPRTVDVLAVVANRSSKVERAKSGPRDYHVTFKVTDTSTHPDVIQVQCFRPFAKSLPSISVGDVVLLRSFTVKTRKHKCFLLSAASSGWLVWRYKHRLQDLQPESYPDNEECQGPPVEIEAEERQNAAILRRWWISVSRDQIEAPTARL